MLHFKTKLKKKNTMTGARTRDHGVKSSALFQLSYHGIQREAALPTMSAFVENPDRSVLEDILRRDTNNNTHNKAKTRHCRETLHITALSASGELTLGDTDTLVGRCAKLRGCCEWDTACAGLGGEGRGTFGSNTVSETEMPEPTRSTFLEIRVPVGPRNTSAIRNSS